MTHISVPPIQEAFEQHDAEKIEQLLNSYAISDTNKARFMLYRHTIEAFLETADWPAEGWNPTLNESGAWRHNYQQQHNKSPNNLTRRSAELVYALVQRCPAEIMDVPFVAQHSIWRHMRTVASEYKNPLLHPLVHQHKRPQWIGKILAYHGQWLNDNCLELTTPYWTGCLQWGGDKAIEGLETFIAQGWLDMTNQDNLERIMTSAAQNAQLAVVEWAIDKTNAGPIPGVVRKLLKHRRLNGVSNPTPLTQGWDSLLVRWGQPDDEELNKMWKSLVKFHLVKKNMPAEPLKLLGVIADLIEQRGLWTDYHFRVVLNRTVEVMNPQLLEEHLAKGKRPASGVLDEALAKLDEMDESDNDKILYLRARMRQQRLGNIAGQAIGDTPMATKVKPKL